MSATIGTREPKLHQHSTRAGWPSVPAKVQFRGQNTAAKHLMFKLQQNVATKQAAK